MKTRIAIIGGGIVGATTAYYLSQGTDTRNFDVTMFDSGHGQATKAAAGIISPWLTKRRNQQWYHLARVGADLLARLASRLHFSSAVYDRSGMIITRKTADAVDALYHLAIERKRRAPLIGRIKKMTPQEIKQRIPLLTQSLSGIMISGGGRVNGRRLAQSLIRIAQQKNLRMVHQKVQLANDYQIIVDGQKRTFDWIVIATGAWIRQTLLPLGIKADIRPQKGQLIVVNTHQTTGPHLPVLSPEGEYDFLPFSNGQLVVGATHEDNRGFDLTFSRSASLQLLRTAQHLVPGMTAADITSVRTGTRGYTSDFGPFFGRVPQHPSLLVGGGLGSSGLTTGPVIGKFLAQIISSRAKINFNYYEKPIEKYFKG